MPARRTFLSDFRIFFLRGLAIALPTVITAGLLFWAYGFLNKNFARPINSAVRWTVIQVTPEVIPDSKLPDWYVISSEQVARLQAERTRAGLRPYAEDEARARVRASELREVWERHWYLQAIGFVVALVVVYLAGVLVGNFLGRRAFQMVEKFLVRLPVIKQVYPNVKQITDFLLGSGDSSLPKGRVCIFEYPRKGIWTVGLMTGSSIGAIEDRAGLPCVTVFVPSSPTPFTGYAVTVPKEDVHELAISFDEAIRFVVSGGVLVPARQNRRATEEAAEFALARASDLAGPSPAAMMSPAEKPPRTGDT